MDIDLLSRMVKEAIIDRDRVALPGLGTFVAEMMPATFSDKGYTINPPYRRLYFRPRPDEDDSLVKIYSASNHISPDLAEKILADFLSELGQVLMEKKVVVFPGLGRLRATKENTFFFVPDEDLEIYSEGFGLEPVSLKSHNESREQLSAAVESLKSIIQPDETMTAESEAPQAEAPEQEEEESAAEAAALEAASDAEPEPEGSQAEAPEQEEAESVAEAAVLEAASEAEPEQKPMSREPESEKYEEAIQESKELQTEDQGPDESELASKEESAAEAAAPSEAGNVSNQEHGKKKISLGKPAIAAIIAISVVVVLFVVYIVLNLIFPGIFDHILYSKDQLQILEFFSE